MEILKALHLVGVSYFVGFLLLDVLVLRSFLTNDCHEKKKLFYEKAKYSLYFFTAVIVVSGAAMFYPAFIHENTVRLKVLSGLFSIFLFFLSPLLVQKFLRGYVGAIYTVVLASALTAGGIAVFVGR